MSCFVAGSSLFTAFAPSPLNPIIVDKSTTGDALDRSQLLRRRAGTATRPGAECFVVPATTPPGGHCNAVRCAAVVRSQLLRRRAGTATRSRKAAVSPAHVQSQLLR